MLAVADKAETQHIATMVLRTDKVVIRYMAQMVLHIVEVVMQYMVQMAHHIIRVATLFTIRMARHTEEVEILYMVQTELLVGSLVTQCTAINSTPNQDKFTRTVNSGTASATLQPHRC